MRVDKCLWGDTGDTHTHTCLGPSPHPHLRPHCVGPGALIRDIRDVRSAIPDARCALHDACGAPRGKCAAEHAARPPRCRGIAAMEVEDWPLQSDVEWKFRSSSDSDVVLGDPLAAPADRCDADADARLGAADETLRLAVPPDADTDDSDDPGGVALGVDVPADTDTDHDGDVPGGVALCFGADSDPENPGGEGGTGRTAHSLALRGRGCGGPGDPGKAGCPQRRRCSSPGSSWLCGGCRGAVSRQWWIRWHQRNTLPNPWLSGPRAPCSGWRRRASGGRMPQFAEMAGRRCQARATPRRRWHATPRQRTSRLRPSC